MSKVKYLSLTNLIAEDEIVEELLQDNERKEIVTKHHLLLNPKINMNFEEIRQINNETKKQRKRLRFSTKYIYD